MGMTDGRGKERMDLETGTTTKEYGEGGSTTTTTSFLTTAYAISFSDFLIIFLACLTSDFSLQLAEVEMRLVELA